MTPPRTYARRGTRPHAAILASARAGTDADPRASRPVFISVGAAVTWYFATAAKLGAAKTSLGATTQQLELGAQITGGRGSVVERELCLLADVAQCLPLPAGGLAGKPDGACRSWRAWAVFLACMRDGHDLAGAAGKVRDLLDAECDWREARALLKDAVWGMREGLKRKGLV